MIQPSTYRPAVVRPGMVMFPRVLGISPSIDTNPMSRGNSRQRNQLNMKTPATSATRLSSCHCDEPHMLWNGELKPIKNWHCGCDDVCVKQQLAQRVGVQVSPVCLGVEVLCVGIILQVCDDRQQCWCCFCGSWRLYKFQTQLLRP